MLISQLGTPALVADSVAIDRNVATMAAARPGRALRPHVKAHKCTALAAVQAAAGHTAFTCATPREVVGMAAAGLDDDLLLANETVDPQRLQAMAQLDAVVTVAIDSEATIAAAATAGIRRCLIDVNVDPAVPDRRQRRVTEMRHRARPGRPAGRRGATGRTRGSRRDGLRGSPDDGAGP